MASLTDRLMKNSKLSGSSVLSKSKFFNEKDNVSTPVFSINLAFSGSLLDGFGAGLSFLAGKSKSFKSLLGLMLAASYQKKYDDAVILFYDSEFGITDSYMRTNGIDTDRVIHRPIKNIEELKFDIMKMLEEVGRDDHVLIFIDSIGNLASKKEVEDALDEKSVADMTRAKQLKSLWRMVTPYLTMNDIPCIAINHTYDTIEMHSKAVMGGGTGGMYSADNVFIIGKRQIKEGKEIVGWQFILNAEKSRFIKEKAAIPFEVTYEGGIDPYSGLLDIARLTGHVDQPKMGWYTRTTVEDDKNWRRKNTSTREFWEPLLSDEGFLNAVTEMYALGNGEPIFRDEYANVLNEGEELNEETGEITVKE